MREKNAAIADLNQLLQTLQNNNKETEKKMAVTNRQAAKLQQELREEENICVKLQEQVTFIMCTECKLIHVEVFS